MKAQSPQQKFFRAIASGRLKTVENLLRLDGSLLESRNKRGESPLWLALSAGYRQGIAQILLDAGANPFAKPSGARGTCLSLALANDPDVAPTLLRKGLPVTERCPVLASIHAYQEQSSDLDAACLHSPEHVPALLAAGALPNATPQAWTSSPLAKLLTRLLERQDWENDALAALALIQAGADPQACRPPKTPAWSMMWRLAAHPVQKMPGWADCHATFTHREPDFNRRWQGCSLLHEVAWSAATHRWEPAQLKALLQDLKDRHGPDAMRVWLKLTPCSSNNRSWGVVAVGFDASPSLEHAIALAKVWCDWGADPNEAGKPGAAVHAAAARWGQQLWSRKCQAELLQLPLDWRQTDPNGRTIQENFANALITGSSFRRFHQESWQLFEVEASARMKARMSVLSFDASWAPVVPSPPKPRF